MAKLGEGQMKVATNSRLLKSNKERIERFCAESGKSQTEVLNRAIEFFFECMDAIAEGKPLPFDAMREYLASSKEVTTNEHS